jgi:hypothetical protein
MPVQFPEASTILICLGTICHRYSILLPFILFLSSFLSYSCLSVFYIGVDFSVYVCIYGLNLCYLISSDDIKQ